MAHRSWQHGERMGHAGGMTESPTRTAFRTCPFCEATCGLEITLRGDEIVRIRGDRDDVFSHGFICPKGSTLKQLHEDPDRLRRPLMKRDGDPCRGHLGRGLRRDRAATACRSSRRTAVTPIATYLGQPRAPTTSRRCSTRRPLAQGLGTRMRFSAGTVDQMPKHVVGGLLFGTPASVPGPGHRPHRLPADARAPTRTSRTAASAPRPTSPVGSRRSAPAAARSSWSIRVGRRPPRRPTSTIAVVPGTDAHLLMAIVARRSSPTASSPSARTSRPREGIDELRHAAQRLHARAVARHVCGSTPRSSAGSPDELAAAPSAAVYGRIGTCTQEFGTTRLVADRRRERPHRQPRPARRDHVDHARDRQPDDAAVRRRRARLSHGSGHSRVPGSPR